MLKLRRSSAAGAIVLGIVGTVMLLVMPVLSPPVQALMFCLYAVGCMIFVSHHGVLHPIAWFAPFYWSYSVTYALAQFSLDPGGLTYSTEAIPLAFSGFISFAIITTLLTDSRPLELKAKRHHARTASRSTGITIATLGLLPIVVMASFTVMASGVSSKREYLSLAAGGLLAYAILLLQVPAAGATLRSLMLGWRGASFSQSAFSPVNILVCGVAVLVVGVTGERDQLFRFALILGLFLYSEYFKYSVGHALIAMATLYLILPLTHSAKAILVAGDSAGLNFGVSLAASDYASAGRILDYVVLRDINWLEGQTVVDAFKRLLFFPGDAPSATAWFHNVARGYYGDSGTSGWGFSLAAEGYVNLGVAGPAVIVGAVGVLAMTLYRSAYRSPLRFLFYLLFCASAIYAIRADVANLLLQVFHHNILIVGFFWMILYVGKRLRWWTYEPARG